MSKYTPLKYNNIYVYPPWGYSIGWFLALSSISCVPLFIIITLLKTQGSFRKVGAGESDPLKRVQSEVGLQEARDCGASSECGAALQSKGT